MFKKYKATELAVVLTNLGSLLGKDTDCAIGLKKVYFAASLNALRLDSCIYSAVRRYIL